ncbi:MAG TPA: hypothetical protein VLI54_01250 [Bacillota bacterium]|nr:hypothetical protein [Bacillota bacterium]
MDDENILRDAPAYAVVADDRDSIYEQPGPLSGRYRSTEQLATITAQLEAGVMPPLPNGYTLVFDDRPTCLTDQYIPPLDYAAYLSRRQVPMAPKESDTFVHDKGHIPGMQRMLSVVELADVTQAGAVNAVNNLEKSRLFTGNFDTLADAMDDLYRDRFNTATVDRARECVAQLAALAAGQDAAPEEIDGLAARLTKSLGLSGYDAIAAERERRVRTRWSRDERSAPYEPEFRIMAAPRNLAFYGEAALKNSGLIIVEPSNPAA